MMDPTVREYDCTPIHGMPLGDTTQIDHGVRMHKTYGSAIRIELNVSVIYRRQETLQGRIARLNGITEIV